MHSPPRENLRLLTLALEETVGNALVLNEHLKIVGGTSGIPELLGFPLPLGKTAPEILCGTHERRPIAEALSRGDSASAEIMRPTPSGERIIQVKSVPLLEGETLRGHLLLLTPLGDAVRGTTSRYGILTASESMRSLLRIMERVARSEANVLVRGETGAGKELVARALHEMSPRRKSPFAAVNCAALPPELLESELFGHVRGAFTGAVKDHDGLFRRAHGGTVFLDEVAELPLAMQAKLLRVVQERTVLPVGGTSSVPVDVRLISATHRALRQEVSAGRFRADLMYRLRVVPLYLPPLRERPADIEPLVLHFVASHNRSASEREIKRVSPGAMRALKKHAWPGNVRELENVIQYAFLLGDGPILGESDLPPEMRDEITSNDPWSEADSSTSPEAARISRALERSGGHRERAAQSLGISRSTLWRRMQEFGIE